MLYTTDSKIFHLTGDSISGDLATDFHCFPAPRMRSLTLHTSCCKVVPGGPVVKNPPSNAGDVGSIPGRGSKIPHATGQLSLRAATTEHVVHN